MPNWIEFKKLVKRLKAEEFMENFNYNIAGNEIKISDELIIEVKNYTVIFHYYVSDYDAGYYNGVKPTCKIELYNLDTDSAFDVIKHELTKNF